MRKEGRSQGMAIGLAPAGELRQLRRRLLVCRGTGAVVSPPGKPSLRGKISTKSKDKGKGSHKAKGLDVRLNPNLVSWRFVGPSGDPLWNRVHLQNYEDNEDDDEEEEEKREVMEVRESEEIDVVGDGGEDEGEEEGKEEEEKDGEDGVMGFYEVWGTWEYMDEEDWCVVGEEM